MRLPAATWTCTTLTAISVGLAGCGLSGGKPLPEPVATASYQPFGADYRGVSRGRTSQYFDDQATETDFGLEYFVRVDIVPAGETLEATLVLDSILLFEGAGGGVSETQVDSARGSVFRAIVAPSGKLTEFSGEGEMGSLATEVADRFLKPFLPVLPAQGAEQGSLWTDTLETRMVVNGLANDIRLVSEHVASEWTAHAGTRALLVRTVSDYTFNGTGTQSGREFTIEGRGRRHLNRYIGEDGRYLGLVSADTADGEARLADMDLVIPIHQTRIDSLSIRG